MDNAATWTGVAPLLALQQYLVVAIDLIGHGKSDHFIGGEYSHFSYLVTVVYAAEALGWSSFILLGHSMGAIVSTYVAGALPSIVESLILVEGIAPFRLNEDIGPRLEIALTDRTKYFKRQPRIYVNIKEAIMKYKENLGEIEEHSAKTIVKRSIIKTPGGISFSHDPRLTAPSVDIVATSTFFSLLRRIRCPLLLIMKKDKIVKYGIDIALKEINPQLLHTKLFEEGGHHIHLDSPNLIIDDILNFLQSGKRSLPKL